MHDFARESQKPTSDFSEMTDWLPEKIVHSVPDAFPLPNRVADRGFEGLRTAAPFAGATRDPSTLRLAALRSG